MVKKIALLFVASGFVMGSLAGCGEKTEETKKVTTTTETKVETKKEGDKTK